jgi:hypothetical protein
VRAEKQQHLDATNMDECFQLLKIFGHVTKMDDFFQFHLVGT